MNQVLALGGPARAAWRPAGLAAWIEVERGRFVPWLPVFMTAGVVVYFMVRVEPVAWAGPAGLAGSVALLVAAWRGQVVRGAALALMALALGFASAQWAAGRAAPVEVLPARAVVLSAVVRGVDILPDGRRLVLEDVRLGPDQPALRRLIRVRMKRGDATEVAAGDRIEVRAVLRPPAPPAYPGAWDLQRDGWFNGVGGGGTALNPVVVRERAAAGGWASWAQGVRDAVGQRAMAALPGPAGTVAATLLNGSTRAIPQRDREAFRDSGLAHLLAVAGLHIGIIMGLFMLSTRLGLAAWPHAALHWPAKAIAAGVALAAGGAYLLLTGAHVPIIRSFAMACLVTLGIALGRRALSLRGLSLAAAALVLIAPQEVVGVSFQMSFAAVLALISGYEALRPLLARLHGRGWGRRFAAHVAALVLTSLLAGTASAPYGAYHFGHVQLYFIAANVVAVPLTAMWVMPLGVLALFLMPLGLERLAFAPMGWGIEAILWIARGVAAWPAATLPTPPMPGWGLALFSLGLVWLCLWRTRVRLLGIAVMLAGLLSPLAAPLPDVLVSSEGRLIAWRGPDGYGLQSGPGAQRFVRDAWQDHLAAGPFRPLGAGCDATSCRLGGVLLLRNGAHQADCAGVQLVISAEPARGVCPGALLDRFTVWRDGAHAVWVRRDGPVVLSDRADRGARPWVPPPPTPRRVVPNLPMAPAEALPPDMENASDP